MYALDSPGSKCSCMFFPHVDNGSTAAAQHGCGSHACDANTPYRNPHHRLLWEDKTWLHVPDSAAEHQHRCCCLYSTSAVITVVAIYVCLYSIFVIIMVNMTGITCRCWKLQ